MAFPMEISQDLAADTVTINGVVYASCVFRTLANPVPSRLYTFDRTGGGAVAVIYRGELSDLPEKPRTTATDVD